MYHKNIGKRIDISGFKTPLFENLCNIKNIPQITRVEDTANDENFPILKDLLLNDVNANINKINGKTNKDETTS